MTPFITPTQSLDANAGAIRDVVITPPSVGHELLAVVRAAMAITFGVWLYLANSPFAASGANSSTRSLLPYQALIRDRPAEDQRFFRELQVALLEAEAARSANGDWPTPEALTADGIEPFAINPAIRGPRYVWRTSRQGRTINYLGVPESAGTAWLLWIQEPDPAAPEAFRADEEHHPLVDGSVLHVSIWSRTDVPRGSLFQAPQFDGWTQIYIVSPSGGHLSLPRS